MTEWYVCREDDFYIAQRTVDIKQPLQFDNIERFGGFTRDYYEAKRLVDQLNREERSKKWV